MYHPPLHAPSHDLVRDYRAAMAARETRLEPGSHVYGVLVGGYDQPIEGLLVRPVVGAPGEWFVRTPDGMVVGARAVSTDPLPPGHVCAVQRINRGTGAYRDD